MGYVPHKDSARYRHLSEIAHEIKYEQDNEHKAESATATDVTAVGVPAAAEEKQEDNNEKNEHHNDIGIGGY